MLSSGSRLGSYEVLSPLGAGGMGEVYRARDLRLGREVAIKVLPEAFATDTDRLARFAREAQLLASLNHPNIAAIHGLEDSDGRKALVLELVPGETLAERITRGPIALDEVLPIARQVVAAVEAAHEQGIIHRDLKPANIKVTVDGIVKVLDFGLAKLAGPTAGVASSSHLSLSPTLTSPALMTGVGVLLGTAAYMAPEQAKGREADRRADVWAIGCLLYEMLSGTRAFEGEDVAETLASVLKGEPDWSRLPGDLPAAIRIALKRCLAKDPTRRLAGLAGLSFVLGEYEALAATLQPPSTPPVVRRSWATAGLVLAAAILAAAVAAWTAWRLKPTPEIPTRRLELALPDGASLIVANTRPLMAISPDARYFAVVGSGGQLFLKTPDKPAFAASEAGANVFNPVFSPDGQWIAFSQNGKLRKLSVAGGGPIDICESGAPPLGISWTDRDTILFSRGPDGIWSVPAVGGTPVRVIAVSKDQIAWGPQLLPGGTDVLFTLASNGDANRPGGWDNAAILIESLSTHQRQTVVNGGSDGHYVSSGHIVYTRQRTMFALPFDVSARKVLNVPVPVLQGVAGGGGGVSFGGQGGASQFAVSNTGTLMYAAQVEGSTDRTVVSIDRAGREAPLPIPARAHTYPRLSPDGQRLALDIRDQKQDIWIWDLRRQVLTPLTFDPVAEIAPLWTPDGTHIVYLRTGKGLFSQAADGSGQAESLTQSTIESVTPSAFTADGRSLLVGTQTASGFDILIVDLATKKVSPLIADPTNQEQNAALSPDGKWVAYQSDETGQMEIYVRPFPNVNGGTWKVSSNGATRPQWSADGHELFFMGGGVQNSAASPLMVAAVKTSPTFEAGPVRQLLPGPFFSGLASRTYDVTRDGQHFIVIKSSGPSTATGRVVLVDNWFQELQRLAPSPK